MRRFRRTALGGALGVLLGALPSHPMGAQLPIPDLGLPPATPPARVPRPTAIESQVTRFRFAGAERGSADGVGLRLVYGRRVLDTQESRLADRTELALFVTHVPEQRLAHAGRGARVRSTSAGLGADLRPFPTPLAGRVDPFVSLGAGLLRTTTSVLAPPPSLRLPPARTSRTQDAVVLAPGLGTRLLLTPRLAVQADARDLMSFGARTQHHAVFGTGLRVTL